MGSGCDADISVSDRLTLPHPGTRTISSKLQLALLHVSTQLIFPTRDHSHSYLRRNQPALLSCCPTSTELLHYASHALSTTLESLLLYQKEKARILRTLIRQRELDAHLMGMILKLLFCMCKSPLTQASMNNSMSTTATSSGQKLTGTISLQQMSASTYTRWTYLTHYAQCRNCLTSPKTRLSWHLNVPGASISGKLRILEIHPAAVGTQGRYQALALTILQSLPHGEEYDHQSGIHHLLSIVDLPALVPTLQTRLQNLRTSSTIRSRMILMHFLRTGHSSLRHIQNRPSTKWQIYQETPHGAGGATSRCHLRLRTVAKIPELRLS